MSFGTQVCGDLAQGGNREWLVTDGLGGYATGTVSGLRTRRYHGLLIVSGRPAARRHLGLAALDAVVVLPSGAEVRLGVHEWAGGAIEPKGHTLLAHFDLTDGVPRWRWQVGATVIEREIAMRPGTSCVAVVHRRLAGPPVTLRLEALCTWRDVHGERYAGGPAPVVESAADGAVVEGAYRLRGPDWQPAGEWWNGVRYRAEADRGLPDSEDLWLAGRFHGVLDDVLEVTATSDLDAVPPPATEIVAAARGRKLTALRRAADQFVIAGPDVVAGYPWFGAWGRDTMISYHGLFLTTGRYAEGRALLANYAETLSEGMIGNTADGGQTEYNTADATLWFLHAVDRHARIAGDPDLAEQLRGQIKSVIDAHLRGTRFGIVADPADGLLSQGADGQALTWMDARVDGRPITQRAGKAVDINALWVNALGGLADRWPDEYAGLHERARDSFGKVFTRPDGLLYDVITPAGEADPSLRPNQLLAWSLPYAPLAPDPAAVTRLAGALLTPLGPRSLAPGDPSYTGRHRGAPPVRDAAYHQGTVWPWLIGPLWDAAGGTLDPALLDGLYAHLGEYGLGSVSETAEGDAPHLGTGCPFQAWSVAELLRITESR